MLGFYNRPFLLYYLFYTQYCGTVLFSFKEEGLLSKLWDFTKTSACRNISTEPVYLLRMQMYSTFTGISKEKQHKCYFQFCKGLSEAWACAQLSLPQKHAVGPISSEVLSKIIFITHQPMVASQSFAALAKSNCSSGLSAHADGSSLLRVYEVEQSLAMSV